MRISMFISISIFVRVDLVDNICTVWAVAALAKKTCFDSSGGFHV